MLLRRRFELTGASGDLDTAIDVAQDLLSTLDSDDPIRPSVLSDLGAALMRRFEERGNAADIEAAADAGRAAAADITLDDNDHAGVLANSALFLRVLFSQTGDPRYLDGAIDLNRQALTARGHHGTADDAHSNDVGLAGTLGNLGATLLTRFEQTGHLADLDEAVALGGASARAVGDDNVARAGLLSNYGTLLLTRFEHTGALADLDQAVDVGRLAVDLSRPGQPAAPPSLFALAISLLARFDQHGRLTVLGEAIAAEREAVRLVEQARTRLDQPHPPPRPMARTRDRHGSPGTRQPTTRGIRAPRGQRPRHLLDTSARSQTRRNCPPPHREPTGPPIGRNPGAAEPLTAQRRMGGGSGDVGDDGLETARALVRRIRATDDVALALEAESGDEIRMLGKRFAASLDPRVGYLLGWLRSSGHRTNKSPVPDADLAVAVEAFAVCMTADVEDLTETLLPQIADAAAP